MTTFVARLIAYLFLGSFCIAGPLFVVVGLTTAVQRAVLIHSGLRAQGTVIAKRPTGSSRVSYAPVIQFTASDGHTHTIISDVYGKESAFSYGQRIRVFYRQDHADAARIDDFAALWTFPLVIGVVGAAFCVVPAIVLVAWMRRTQAQAAADRVSRGLRWALGLLLTGGGVVLLAIGLGIIWPDSSSVRDSRVLVGSMGVLLLACGVQVGQWVAMESRLSHALGGAAITSMAVIFGWVAILGDAAGFSGGVSMGNAAVTSSGSITAARIAFGIGSILCALASLWAWKQVVRPRG